MRVALFDLDGTLTPLDTEDEWILALGAAGLIDVRPHRRFNVDYHAGELDRDAYLAWYAGELARLEPAQAESTRDAIVARVLASIEEAPRSWIAHERARCDAIALVSASNAYLVEPIGAALGFDAALGTIYELRDGRFTGGVVGELNMGAGKVRRVDAWLATLGSSLAALEHCACYGDSVNDLPLLESTSEPIAVDPHPRLAAVAEQRGWRIVRTRRTS